MRALLAIVVVLTALWSGAWWYGATTVERTVRDWFAAQPAEVAQTSGVEVNGIPNRLDLTVNGLELRDPASGIGWKTPFAQVYAMSWKPWHLIAALPSGQEISTPDQVITVTSDRIIGNLVVTPSTDLALQEVVAELATIALRSDAGWTLGLDNGIAALRLDESRQNGYRFGLKLTGITPDAGIRSALATTDLPATIDEIYLDAEATLSAPLDRFVQVNPPQLLTLTVAQGRVSWGELQFHVAGSLVPDAQGFASGTLDLRLQGWQNLPPALVALGLIQPDLEPGVTSMMAAMAQQSGDPLVVQLPLTMAEGRMTVGPFPLGPAPRLR